MKMKKSNLIVIVSAIIASPFIFTLSMAKYTEYKIEELAERELKKAAISYGVAIDSYKQNLGKCPETFDELYGAFPNWDKPYITLTPQSYNKLAYDKTCVIR